MRITDDISVSRCHAVIKKSPKGEYFLEDYNSKFGTLVQVQYPIYLSPQNLATSPLVLQSGKTCLYLHIRQQVSCFPSCFRTVKKEKHENLITLDNKHLFPQEFLSQANLLQIQDMKKLKVSSVKGRSMASSGMRAMMMKEDEGN